MASKIGTADELLTTREVAEIIGVHPRTIQRWRQKGYLLPTEITPGGVHKYHPVNVRHLQQQMRAWS